jgi:hypothetical protein
VRLILPGELAKHAISEGTKSVTSTCLSYRDAYCALSDSACRILVCGCQVDAGVLELDFYLCVFGIHCTSVYFFLIYLYFETIFG